jgi:hypothetical protein
MSEIIVSCSENRAPAVASVTIRASCKGSESAHTQAVESGSESEGFVASSGGCSKLVAKIKLPHRIPVRDGAGTENDQMSLSISSVLNVDQVILRGNGGFPAQIQTKVVPRRFVLWHGRHQNNGGVGAVVTATARLRGLFLAALAYSMASHPPQSSSFHYKKANSPIYSSSLACGGGGWRALWCCLLGG